METSRGNSIKDRLAEWRSSFDGSKLTADELDELQSHMEDSLNEFLAKKLSIEEAWLLAVDRMGATEDLKREFQKVEDAKGNLISRLFWAILILFLAYGISALTWELFLNISKVGGIRVTRFMLLLGLFWVVYALINQRKALTHTPILRAFIYAGSIWFVVLLLGFLTSFEGPWKGKNENRIFEKYSPQSAIYQKELLREFCSVGTENLYYLYKSYFTSKGQHFIIVEAVGKDFNAVFPLNITNANHPIMKNFIRVKGESYGQVEMQGLEFDVESQSLGTQYVFRDLGRFAD